MAETVAGQIASAVENSRLFEEMQQAKEAAVAANDAKSAFLTNVSHELRTPLTSVVGFAKIIRKRLDERVFPLVPGDDPRAQRAVEQVRNNVEIIVAEGERLTTLINNVLDLAKIEAGKFDWDMEPLALSTIVDRGVAATASLFEEKRLAPDARRRGGPAEVVGDRDSLIQVVINLLSNAVKFTEHGSVTCRARHDGDEVVISVTDTGMGIAEADQPQRLRAVRAGRRHPHRRSRSGPASGCPSASRSWSATAVACGSRARSGRAARSRSRCLSRRRRRSDQRRRRCDAGEPTRRPWTLGQAGS